MEFEILDALEDLRYEEKLDEVSLQKTLNDETSFSKILEWISKEMKSSGAMDETITRIENSDDIKSFHMELSSFLKELGCPYPQLLNGSMEERFGTVERRLLALNFLLAELQAARIHHVNSAKQLKVELAESETAKLLREMMQTLGIPKPPAGVTLTALLARINERVNEILKKMPPRLKDKPCFTGQLSEKQWHQLEDLNKEFREEYKMRREMLLKRLDVTVQSFHWSDRLKHKKEDINRIFREKRESLDPTPAVSISEVLSARSDLAIIAKTCDAIVRKHTKSEVNKVVIGKVPDRGGRPNEAQPPPPEMPPWQQRQGGSGTHGWAPGPQQQRDYGEGRGPRGGLHKPRVQGGWSDHGQHQQNYYQQPQQVYQQQQQNFGNYQANQYSQPQQQPYGGGGGHHQQGYQQGGGGYRGDGYDQQHRGRGGHRGGGGRGGGGHRGGGGYRGGGRHQY